MKHLLGALAREIVYAKGIPFLEEANFLPSVNLSDKAISCIQK
jgi:hypothetical protein